MLGILFGYLTRKQSFKGISKAITALIWILLFLLGVEVGSDKQIIEGIGTLGLEALIITSAAILGSCLTAWGLWYVLYKKKGDQV